MSDTESDSVRTTTMSTQPQAPTGGGVDPTADVVSDPAKDDTEGQDWSDEGGATAAGPATATEPPD